MGGMLRRYPEAKDFNTLPPQAWHLWTTSLYAGPHKVCGRLSQAVLRASVREEMISLYVRRLFPGHRHANLNISNIE
jgi:hypothetical protein